MNKRRQSISRKVSNDSGLRRSLLEGDTLQMTQVHQPKSFFSHEDGQQKADGDETRSVDSEEQESFETSGYSWDFVIVFPIHEPGKGPSVKLEVDEIVFVLHSSGLQTYLFKSAGEDEIFCKVRPSLNRLRVQAELIEYNLVYDFNTLYLRVKEGVQGPDGKDIVKSVEICHDPSVTTLRPYEYIYDVYTSVTKDYFENAEMLNHPFSAQHRLKLLQSIISSPVSDGGAGLDLDDLIKDGSILTYYPLHEKKAVMKRLEKHWLPWSVHPWQQPIDSIRDYFGEKVGMYFEFLGHYTTWLLPSSIAGVVVMFDIIIEAAVYGDLPKALATAFSIPLFCTFIAIWAQLMLEYWKRTEATKAMEWGMSDFEEAEKERSQFVGKEVKSHIDGKPMKYYPESERSKKRQISNLVITAMVLLVICCVGVIFYLKFYLLVQSNNATLNLLGSILPSVLNAIQIQVLTLVYTNLAIWLTDQENLRTETEYEDALVSKLFAFQFVNSYASFFYIAFIKKFIGDPCQGSCMSELSMALAIIFGTRLVVGNAQEVLIPLVMQRIKQRQEMQARTDETPAERERRLRIEANITRTEREYTLEVYDPVMSAIDDYCEITIQYGYVTLFVAAFPLAPLLAYLSNVVEIRTDGWKLLHAYRRVTPTGCQDIGSWGSIFQVMSIASVVTNAGIMVFTMDIFDVTPWTKLWILLGFQYFIFCLMGYFAAVVDDVPEEVKIQLKRQDFLVEKVNQIVNQIPDLETSTWEKQGNQVLQINEVDDELKEEEEDVI